MSELAEAHRVRTRTIESRPLYDDLDFDEPLIHTYTQTTQPRQVPAKALASAVITWLAAVYGLCYIVLPLVASALGLHAMFLGNLVLNTITFVPVALLTATMVAAIKPDVVLSKRAPRDPVLAATFGSLAVWFGAHELFSALAPITAMPIGEALSFTAMNAVESSLIGMMLASFARTPLKALALGAAFQTLLVTIFLGWLL
ncbi:MAG: hypothetical protein H6736_19435 [Alphaproteobacteria bacterium]|nr:hypothetical protein [Alphaproteobacteria bacterium]MCB9693985.1 hypothetical protein [Alphaproteobacteria bacterium]